MKKPLTLFFVFALCFPLLAFAGTVRFDENYSLRKGDIVEGDLYAIGSNTTVAGTITGDLVTTGMAVFVGGNEVNEDALVLANTAHIISTIKGDLRILARKVYIGGSIEEDVVAVGQSVEVLPETSIKGSLSVAAGNIAVLGKVDGSFSALAGEVFIDEEIAGDVSLRADKVILGPHAVILGKLSYSASLPVEIREGGRVVGETVFTQINTRSQAEKFIPTLWGTWVFIKFVILLLSALIFHGVLRNISERFVTVSVTRMGGSLLRGFLTMVGVPIAAFIGFLTFIGIPFSLLALALYVIGILFASVYAPIVLGTLLFRFTHKDQILVNWKTILLGVFGIMVIDFIPVVGQPISYILLLIALGGIYQVLFDKFVEVR